MKFEIGVEGEGLDLDEANGQVVQGFGGGGMKKVQNANRSSVMDIGSGPQVFLDDFFLESAEGAGRIYCPPKRHPYPVVPQTETQRRIQPFIAVRYDPEKARFRMWYSLIGPIGISHAYAESSDGIRWEFPNLGLVEVAGNTRNNLLPTVREGATGYPISLIDHGPDFSPLEQRFKFLGFRGVEEKVGLWGLVSPDGLNWKRGSYNPVLPYHPSYNDIVDVFYDPDRRRYVALIGLLAGPEDGYIGKSRTGPIRRLIGQSESTDFVHWSEPRRIMEPSDKSDLTEFYGMSVFLLNGLFLGFVRILRDDLPADNDGPVEGIGWTELAVSRDGNTWNRLHGKYFDRNPVPGTWDHAMAWATAPVLVGDQMLFYYGGYQEGHKIGKRQIGLASSLPNRFVALENEASSPAYLRTKPFRTTCRFLFLNLDALKGTVRVQLRNARNQVLENYAFDDCLPISGNHLSFPTRWRNAPQLPESRKEGIILDVEILRGRIYAVHFSDKKEEMCPCG